MEFEDLTPYVVIDMVEEALGCQLTGYAAPLPSYINRVYELETTDKQRIVAKFYRPARWDKETLLDEHKFTIECAEAEVPVVAPMTLENGQTLGCIEGIFFVVFTKRAGRRFEITDDEGWARIGGLIGSMHMVGSSGVAENRVTLHPDSLTRSEVDYLVDGQFITASYESEFRKLMDDVFSVVSDRFNDVEPIRIHADCHYGNILDRMDEGLLLIDFDDMMMGPAIQDLWLVLPDHIHNCRPEFDAMIDGYEQFAEFDYFSLKLLEPLRILRIIYFLSWCARQSADFKFQHNFPDWGKDAFWRTEIADIRHQLNIIREDDKRRSGF